MGITFKPLWPVLLISALIFPVLISLGCWQLSRAEEKRALFAKLESKSRSAPLARIPSDLSLSDAQFQPVQLSGQYLTEPNFLIENKVQNGKIGFEVLSVFEMHGAEHVLVNRGWISGGVSGRVVPEIPQVDGLVELRGYLHKPSLNSLHRGQIIEQYSGSKIIKVLSVDIASIGKVVGESLNPWVLRLNADSPSALSINWTVANMLPSKHIGYATQWFSMAFVLLLANMFVHTNCLQWLKRDKK